MDAESSQNLAASATQRQRRTYHPDIRELVLNGHGSDVVRQLKNARSTVAGWRGCPLPPIVSVNTVNVAQLQVEIVKLRRLGQDPHGCDGLAPDARPRRKGASLQSARR